MLHAVKRRSIAIVGAGRLGSVLGEQLTRAGYRILEVIARDNPRSLAKARRLARKLKTQARGTRRSQLSADLIWFCVPDAQIARAAAELSHHDWKGRIAIHSSGVLPSDELQRLRDKGARIASVHPLMTFIAQSSPDLAGVPFAVEGDQEAIAAVARIVSDLGGEVFRIHKRDKIAYHAFATMACPLLIALLASSEKVAELARMSQVQARQRMLPILRETVANYEKFGAAKSFTGPFVRGDLETIKRHLKGLKRALPARKAYIALAEAALEYLPAQNRRAIRQCLKSA